MTLATAGDLAAARATLKGVLRPAPLATLRTAAADLGSSPRRKAAASRRMF
ncbi:hypothetical protein NKI56_25185 [Mesorhizobium sp. M0622]|uniref:hypothetical protein n=1 Tax=unclassified Mesorhizobium TaxID=325217 RepID=UPI00333B41C2